MSTLHRRDWLKQSSLAAFGLGFGAPVLAKRQHTGHFFNTEQSLINLGSNENPYGISPNAKQAIIDTIPIANRYAFNIPDLFNFRATLAKFYGVGPENILVTAGSSIILDLFPRYFFKPGGNVVTASPTFFLLPDCAKKIGFTVNAVPVGNDRGIDLAGMLSAINGDTQLAYLVNPNNPTGTLLKPAAVKSFCVEASKKTPVLIDEAYLDFIDAPDNESMIPLAASNPNVFVTRTFSKIHGMAGLRIGFLIGHADSIKKLDQSNFTESWVAVSDLSAAAAMASLKDEQHRQECKVKNAAARDYTIKALQALNLNPIPSHTNFILFPLGKNYDGNFAEFMLKKNITLRQMDCLGEKHGRVSVGTMGEMQQFIKVMKETWKA